MTKVNLSIIYYSSTGTNYQLAKWAEEAARESGAEVRIRKVKELAPESAIATNEAWKKHFDETKRIPEATNEDLEWQMPSFSVHLLDSETFHRNLSNF